MALTDLFNDIADAIREKDGTSAEIVASTFPARIRAIPTGIGGVQIESIAITTPPIRTIYIAGETFDPTGMAVYATYSNGQTMCVNHSNLTFDPPGPIQEGTNSVTVNFQWGLKMASASQPITLVAAACFGVMWDYSSESTALTRLTPETDPNGYVTMPVSSEPSPATGNGLGSSPFDGFMPWSGMEEYNIVGGEVSFKKGEDGFSRTLYDTMVYIPPFYCASVDDSANKKRYWYVSGKPFQGGQKHPGSEAYIGKYLISEDGKTVSGGTVASNLSANAAITLGKSRGSGYYACGYAQISAIRLLYLIEFADMFSQQKIGNGTSFGKIGMTDSMPYHTGSYSGVIQYRGIEGIYGQKRCWIPGATYQRSTRKFYICLNPDQFSSSIENYSDVGIVGPSSPGYLKTLGFSEEYPWLILPGATGGTSKTYTTDYIFVDASIAALAVSYDPGGSQDGMFYFDFYRAYDTSHASYTTRGMFIKQESTSQNDSHAQRNGK